MLRTRSYMVFFDIKGQVNPESMIQSGRSSNLSEILCLSRLSATFIKFRLKLSRLCPEQGRICCFFSALKGKKLKVRSSRNSNSSKILCLSIVRSGRNSNSSEIFCLSRSPASLIKIRLKRLCSRQGRIWCFFFFFFFFFFCIQGQITPNGIVRSGRNSNLSKIICNSDKDPNKPKVLCTGQGRI